MTRYSIVACNYNMAGTVERSLRSILDQLTPEYEVVVVDGGSTDGSVEILQNLEAEYDQLRVVYLDPDPDRHLGADRQRAIEEAVGEYVLPQLDMDDVYFDCITDFVAIYHELERGFDGPLFLSGVGLNIAPRSLLLDIPYRNLPTSEDRDLWRRLHDRRAILWLEHAPVLESIGYERDLYTEIRRRDFAGKVCDFQCGLTLGSCLLWSLSHPVGALEEERTGAARLAKKGYDFVTYLVAFVIARRKPKFETPSKFRERGALERAIAETTGSLAQLEELLNVGVDRHKLSDVGQRLFCAELNTQ